MLEKQPQLRPYKMWWKPSTKFAMSTLNFRKLKQKLQRPETFAELSELPNIVGAIDGSHVTIKAPKDSAGDYFSRYQQHDFIIQAVVNGRKPFLDFACGYPGSMHDTRVSRRRAIFGRAESEEKSFHLQPLTLMGTKQGHISSGIAPIHFAPG